MTQINLHKSHYSFGTKNFVYDPKNIETYSLQELLTPVMEILKEETKTAKSILETFGSERGPMEEIDNLFHFADLLTMHFDLSLKLLASQTDKEVLQSKERFSLIKHRYEKLESVDQLTPTPAKYVVVLFYDKMIVSLPKLFNRVFHKKRDNRFILDMSDENKSKLKILAYRFELAEEYYSRMIIFPKDDIFSLPKSSPVWQELYKDVTFKEVLTEKEAIKSFKKFELTNNIGHVIVKNQIENNGILHLQGATSLLKDLIYYGTHQRKAETLALLRLVHPKPEDAFQVWNLPEAPFVALSLSLDYTIIAYDELIYLPRLFPMITREVIEKEYERNIFNTMEPLEKLDLSAPDLLSQKELVLKELFKRSESKVQVRILSDESLDLEQGLGNMFRGLLLKATRVITGPEKLQPQPEVPEFEGAIVIHIHGGGFVSMSSGTHRVYLNRWVKSLKMVFFSIDYRLAPKNMYPDALDDVWQAYLWILNYAETILNIKTKQIILFGDSAGATLALALQFRLMKAGLPTPKGCLLIYPALLVDEHSCSPSAFASLDDPVLPTAILKECVRAYVGDEFRTLEDPCISPFIACDELLKRLPPIRMVVGSKDPLHDDSWRFLAKMRKLNKNIKLIVHENIRHAYLCHQHLKKFHVFMEEACDLIQELLTQEDEQNSKC